MTDDDVRAMRVNRHVMLQLCARERETDGDEDRIGDVGDLGGAKPLDRRRVTSAPRSRRERPSRAFTRKNRTLYLDDTRGVEHVL